jgi:EAL and modified HD-GYP domain-containing signal transduction protein
MDRFMARQPVFDRRMEIIGYELLHRSGPANVFVPCDGDQASSRVISDACFLHDLDIYAGNAKLFVNVTTDVLVKGYVTMLPADRTVVEILESVDVIPEVVTACQELRQAGYTVALDDYCDAPRWKPLLPFVDILKIDFLATETCERKRVARHYRPLGIRLLAEKVETPAIFREAAQSGYELFQGYFFKVPVMICAKDIPSQRLHYLNLLAEIHRPESDVTRLTDVIKADVSLTYKLLRYINSAFFGVRQRVDSVRHALLLLGVRELRRWASLVALTCLAEDAAAEVTHSALVRARFCEGLAEKLEMQEATQSLFLLGLLSLIDVIVGRPMEEILSSLPIEDEIKQALLGESNRYREILDIVTAYEAGQWDRLPETAASLGLAEGALPAGYEDALRWSQEHAARVARAA